MDKGVTKPLFGFYRAKVVDNRDKEMFGRVLIWIPDLMPDIEDTKGVWAYSANNPVGGRNTQYEDDNHFMGTSYIPRKGSWVFVFFEMGNINRPFYFGAIDIEQAKVLPENQLGNNPQDKWTIFKSHEGRTIVISDDPFDARVEITGKKRKIKEPPSGDRESVYEIDQNQTTILLDERAGKEKILIRSHKGDFFNIDIENRKLHINFESDIQIKTNGKLSLTATNAIDLKSKNNINIESGGSINLKSAANININSGSDMNLKSDNNLTYSATQAVSGLAGGQMSHDASSLMEQSGVSKPASGAGGASEANPEGERN